MVITRTTAEKVGSSISGTARVTVDFAVAQAKAEISRESVKEVSWGTDHQYRRRVQVRVGPHPAQARRRHQPRPWWCRRRRSGPAIARLLTEGPRHGAWDLGPVQLAKGISWVNVNRVADAGAGRITLVVDTVGEFTVDCPSTEARINVNQLDLAEGRKGRLHIETTDNVRWIASIRVPR